MSKSSPSVQSRILITDSPQEIQSKITLAVADSIKFVTYNPINKPRISNLMADELKSRLVDVLVEELRPIQVKLERLQGERTEPHNCFEVLNPAVPKTLVHNFWMIMIIGHSLSKSRWCLKMEWRAIERNMRSQATNTVSIKPMPPVVEASIGLDVSPLFDRRAKPGWLKVFGMGAVKANTLGSEKAASSKLVIGQSMQRCSTNLSLPKTSHPISK
ncbi:hypothetical protein BY996DRAFT_6528796 [Phakopsora pachyrhizi]|nr:hypothetical protein BY996DRAFT_6528796 [Phakopsora pachyrhizi]